MDTHTHKAWTRLGELLLGRRVELDVRYRNRRTFAAEVGLDYRVLYDIESARRTNFSDTTKRAIEQAYRLKAGNLDQVLQGGDLDPSEPILNADRSQPPATLPEPERVYEDDAEQHLWETPALSDTERRQLIYHLQAMRRAQEAPERNRPQAEIREFRRRTGG
ncbi:hypothetical protein [Nonomuraea sp. NPDC050643]|uniref:hypothetical protein n=1 Tax=Nonomuraea sp. NPDC050643 TaxID=3155660 RepID=UPI0033F5A0F2